MAWYPSTNDTYEGLGGLMNYTKDALMAQNPTLGASLVGLAFIAPVWFVVFFPLARFNVLGAWTAAWFISWLLSMLFMAMGVLSGEFFLVALVAWIGGAIGYFITSRG